MKKKENQKILKIDFRDLFNNNTFVLIFSIVIAIGVWFSVYVDQRPNSNTFITDVPITINYENSMAKDLGLEIIGDSQFVTDIQVNGKKYKITRLEADDFTAQVSLANVTEPGEYTLPVQVIRKVSDPEYSVISWTTTEVKLKFDKVVTKEFPIEVVAPGLTAADGYIMEKAYSDIEALTVKGPEAVVNTIQSCVIQIGAEEKLTESFTTSANAVLLDAEGNEVRDNQLIIDNIDVISVTIPIYKVKTLPLKVEFVNVPKGFPTEKLHYTLSVKNIKVASAGETIDSIEAIMVGPIDFRNIDINHKATVPIELKAGIKNVDGLSEVVVTFNTDEYISKMFEVSNVVCENDPAGYKGEKKNNISNVKIVGPKNVVEKLTSQDIVAIADLSQLSGKVGNYNVSAKVYCNNGAVAWAVGEYSANITLKQK